MESALENPFSCKDQSQFLQAVLKRKRSQAKHSGVRAISRSAGFASPATLSMILNGKRNLTPAVAEKLSKALKLSSRERKYLFALMEKARAKSETAVRLLEEQLFKIRNGQDLQSLEWKQYRFLSVWYYPALYVMVGQRTFREDLLWLARRLGRGVGPEDVETALDDMLALGLLRMDEGRFQQALGAIDTDKDINNLSTHKYHQKMIQLALEALDKPVEQRGMNGLTFSITKDKVSEIKAKIREFRRELNETYSQTSDGELVYQLNVQFFPLTEEVGL
jgi:uncharacterized protein (TIGR02147 family)